VRQDVTGVVKREASHDPRFVSAWEAAEFHERVEAVRQRFVDTFEHWPGPSKQV